MNRTLGEFFARGGTEIVGVASEVLVPAQFQKIADRPTTWRSPMSSAVRL